MGRGIGAAQRAILDTLADGEYPCITVMDLAERLGVSDRQVRRAVRALEDRGLVCITRGHVWHGVGEYGPLVERDMAGLDVPTTETVDGVDYVRTGMPAVALEVWLPTRRTEYLERQREAAAITDGARQRATAGGSPYLTDEELERMRLLGGDTL